MDRKLDRLFRRFRTRGDVGSLGELFDLGAPELARVALYLCRDPQMAEDVVQATFQTAIEKAGAYDGKGHVLPWMLGILANHARAARAGARRTPDPDRLAQREVRDPAAEVAGDEFRELVEDGVASLPDAYERAVRPYLEYGKSPSEIARSLGISANAARVRLHRGLKLLRRALPAGAAPSVASGMAPESARVTGTGLDLQKVRGALFDSLSEGPSSVALAAGTSSTTLGATLMSTWPALAGTAVVSIAATFLVTRHIGHRQLVELERRLRNVHDQLAQAQSESAERSEGSDRLAQLELPGPASAPAAADGARQPVPSHPGHVPAPDAADWRYWLERLNEARDNKEVIGIAYELVRLDEDVARDVMLSAYRQVERVHYRQQVLKPFVFENHPHALVVLDLAATDPSMEVRRWAWEYLERYAFRDFSLAPSEYPAWYARFEGKPLAEVLRTNARELVERLRGARGEELRHQMSALDRLDLRPGDEHGVDLRAVLMEAGLGDLIRGWMALGTHGEVQKLALRWLGELNADEQLLRDVALPVVQARDLYDASVVSAAWNALGREGETWAVRPILDEMVRIPSSSLGHFGPASALGEIGDPSVIPTLIAMIVADDTYGTVYGVGYFALGKLTGVDYDESHDGAWWVAWWEANRHLFPDDVSSLPIPVVSLPQ